MDRDFWQQKWQANQIGFHMEQPHPLLTRCWPRLQVGASARVMVPLCGKSPDLGWLAARGHHVIGVELSEIAARAFFDERQLPVEVHGSRYRWANIELIVADLFDLTRRELGRVDAVYDRAALVALPPGMRSKYVDHLRETAGAVPKLLIALEYATDALHPPPFSIDRSEIRSLYGTSPEVLATRSDRVKSIPVQETAYRVVMAGRQKFGSRA